VQKSMPGVPERLHQFKTPVYRILGHNPGPMTGPGTNSYLIGRGRRCLLDPGPDDDKQFASLMTALGEGGLEAILVTHTHRDHSPLATRLQRQTGAELLGLPAPDAVGQDKSFQPTREWRHDHVLDLDGIRLRAVHTPGHVSNHLCYLLEEEKLLFTGDHVLEGTTPVILPPDGNMTDYLNSLRYLKSLHLEWLAPGHGELIADPVGAIDGLCAHRLRREEKIIAALTELGQADEKALLRIVYDDIPANLLTIATKTQLAHLLKLQAEARATCTDGRWRLVD